MNTGNLKKSNYSIYHSYYLNDSVESVLKRLEPYKPKRLILGSHFIPKGCAVLYRDIPIVKSDDEFELDFEL